MKYLISSSLSRILTDINCKHLPSISVTVNSFTISIKYFYLQLSYYYLLELCISSFQNIINIVPYSKYFSGNKYDKRH